MACFLFLSFAAQAQLIHPSLSAEVQYPDALMSPTTYNLDRAGTKYLSNFAYPAPAPYGPGMALELAGWSTDNDGGFTFGESNALPLAIYKKHGAVALPDVRDVQVGYLQQGGNNYIVVAYYDTKVERYGYSLYLWDLIPRTATLLYSYHFTDPNQQVSEYTPTGIYHPSHPGSAYPVFPAPPKLNTMEYNRKSMDINKDANKVIMVMTDNATGYMYTASGIIGIDTVIFSPNLPISLIYPAATSGPAYPEIPVYHFPYPATPGYVSGGGGTYYDYEDAFTGIFARYVVATGKYYYSYYPIDQWIYISEYDGVSITRPASNSAFSPLIRLKAVSSVTTPCINPYMLQYWPDVAFGGEALSYVFYSTELNDLYINEHSYGISFNDLYTYTGVSVFPGSCYTGFTDYPLECKNTADNKYISGVGTIPPLYTHESSCESLPLTADVTEIRAKIDAPDLGGGDKWAITFAYKPDFTLTYYSAPYIPALPIHLSADHRKNNIYVRSNYEQSILTNGRMGNTAINLSPNTAPTISFKPMGITNVSVAWASEDAGRASGSNWAYIGVELNTTVPFGTTSPSSLLTFNDYLHLSTNPADDCGDNPLVSLSKHTDGLSYLYSTYTQEDAAGTYTVLHKNKPNSSTSYWRTSSIDNAATNRSISVSPNPFINSLHISSSEPMNLQISDILGRTMGNYSGTAEEINKQLDALAPQLSSGTYILKANNPSGTNDIFKLTKQ